jgi:hypothetical protein
MSNQGVHILPARSSASVPNKPGTMSYGVEILVAAMQHEAKEG